MRVAVSAAAQRYARFYTTLRMKKKPLKIDFSNEIN